MNRAVLTATKIHLEATGHHVAVGQRPADVDGQLPFTVVYMANTDNDNNDDDVANIDRAGNHIVHLQTWGTTYDSAGALAEDMDDRMKAEGIAPVGHVVTLVLRDRSAGPYRDDSTYPEPSRFRIDQWYRIWTEDSTI